MFLVDTHMHSIVSFDSETPRAEMARAAAERGLSAICFTDHYDVVDEYGNYVGQFDWSMAEQEQKKAIEANTGVKLLYGVEMGNAFADWATAERVLAGQKLDYIIGSVHNTSKKLGYLDYYHISYTPELCKEHLEDYFDRVLEIAQWGQFDALGHLPYPLRYMRDRDRCQVSVKDYWEQITAILQTIVSKGIALEVNTKRFHQCHGDYEAILLRYKELGGELVTIGADAHKPSDVASGIEQGFALIKSSGFDAVTLFEGRKPTFIKL